MKRTLSARASRLRAFAVPRLALANEDAPVSLANAVLSGAAFTVTGDGSLFFPYGEIPHKQGLQRFTREAAERMASHFAKPLQKALRWIDGVGIKTGAGVPVYIGHPDVPGMANEYPDKAAYGWIESISAEPEGMRVAVKWSTKGAELVSDAQFRFSSPFWNCEPDGKGGFTPVVLVSIGLTNKHNMPTPAIANADEGESEEGKVKSEDIKHQASSSRPALNKLLGLAEDDEDEDAFENAIKNMHERCVQMENEITTLKEALAKVDADKVKAEGEKEAVRSEKEKAEEDKASLQNSLGTAQQEIAAMGNQLALANTALGEVRAALTEARTVRITAALHGLEKEGRLLANESQAEASRLIALANDAEITAALDALATVKPKLKTVAVSADAAGSKGKITGIASRTEKAQAIANAVEEEITALKPSIANEQIRYEAAWAKARQKHPHLFN